MFTLLNKWKIYITNSTWATFNEIFLQCRHEKIIIESKCAELLKGQLENRYCHEVTSFDVIALFICLFVCFLGRGIMNVTFSHICIYIYIHIYIYGIHHWRIFRSSYRKLAWVGFEPTTTQFRSDALTDWAISHEFNSLSEPTFFLLIHSSFLTYKGYMKDKPVLKILVSGFC